MTRKKMLASAVALSLAGGCMVALPAITPAFAAEKPAPVAQSQKAANGEFVKISEDGFSSLQDIHAARLAIFNGHPDTAKTLLEKAEKSLTTADTKALQLREAANAKMGASAATEKESKSAELLVPVDARMSIADDFTMTPEKAEHIRRANEHLRRGETRQAIEELRQGDIHVQLVKIMMPVEQARKGVDKALQLVDGQKYYEANLALKGVEDGLVIETERFVQLPMPPATKTAHPAKEEHSAK